MGRDTIQDGGLAIVVATEQGNGQTTSKFIVGFTGAIDCRVRHQNLHNAELIIKPGITTFVAKQFAWSPRCVMPGIHRNSSRCQIIVDALNCKNVLWIVETINHHRFAKRINVTTGSLQMVDINVEQIPHNIIDKGARSKGKDPIQITGNRRIFNATQINTIEHDMQFTDLIIALVVNNAVGNIG